MKARMEVNNVSIDPRDDPYRNYFIEQEGEPYEDPILPKKLADQMVIIECNKRTNIESTRVLGLSIDQIVR